MDDDRSPENQESKGDHQGPEKQEHAGPVRIVKRSLPFGISLRLMLLIAIQRIISPSRNRKPKEKTSVRLMGKNKTNARRDKSSPGIATYITLLQKQ